MNYPVLVDSWVVAVVGRGVTLVAEREDCGSSGGSVSPGRGRADLKMLNWDSTHFTYITWIYGYPTMQ